MYAIRSYYDEVMFVGAIYDLPVVQALRFYARFYVHGHTVGGTNPSLVEALGAGSPVLAHANRFNRWVAGEKALFFSSETECETHITRLTNGPCGGPRMVSKETRSFDLIVV